jgi:hypothetical protein
MEYTQVQSKSAVDRTLWCIHEGKNLNFKLMNRLCKNKKLQSKSVKMNSINSRLNLLDLQRKMAATSQYVISLTISTSM